MQVQINNVANVVKKIVDDARVVDLHTHLYPKCCDKLFLRGIDDLLTYHYLIVETLRYGKIEPEDFFALSVEEQANEVWNTLFVERTPISEACRGVLTILNAYGIDAANSSLEEIREYFKGLSIDEHVDKVFEAAKLDYIVMTNDPFDPVETSYWGPEFKADKRFRAALRIDPILVQPEKAVAFMKEKGYDVDLDLSQTAISELLRFLDDSYQQIDPVYLAASLPPTFGWKDGSICSKLVENVIIPFCKEKELPLALMIGVRKLVNPRMRLGGDSVGKACVAAIEEMCKDNPDVNFLITLLSRENQHELCVAARKFPNLKVFGCWWFLNNPSIIREMTMMRVELLGLSFIPQHSDARVLDQLVYKWAHSKEIIADVLAEKYTDLLKAGWKLTEEDIRRDVDMLFSGNANEVLGTR